MIRYNSRDYSDACILAKGTTTVPNMAGASAPVNNTDKKVIFKNCTSFPDCIAKIYNAEVDDVQTIDMVMPTII